MKNTYLATLVAIISFGLFTNVAFAQGGYVNVNAGYGFSMGAQTLSNFIENTGLNNLYSDLDFINYESTQTFDESLGTVSYPVKSEQILVSLGKGLNIGGAFGYMFNEHIGAELGLSYLMGGKSYSKISETRIYPNYPSEYYNQESTISSKMFRMIPTLVIEAGGEKINPYAKFGLVVGFGSVLCESNYNSYDEWDGLETTSQKIQLSGGSALGLTSSIGAMYNLSEKMSLFGELNMINMSYSPTKGELTEYKENGVDKLSSMSINEKEVEYVDSYDRYYFFNDSSKPSQVLKQSLPFGSFGINLGMRVSF